MCVAVPGCTIRDAKFRLRNAAPVMDVDVFDVIDIIFFGVTCKSRPLVPGERGVVAIRKSEFILCLRYKGQQHLLLQFLRAPAAPGCASRDPRTEHLYP